MPQYCGCVHLLSEGAVSVVEIRVDDNLPKDESFVCGGYREIAEVHKIIIILKTSKLIIV
jgi:hypothetical protein